MATSRSFMKFFLGVLFVMCGLTQPVPAFAKKTTPLPPSGFENKPGNGSKFAIRGLATLHHSVFGGTIEIYGTKDKLVYRFDSSVHPKGGYFELPIRDRRLKNANSDDDPFTSGLAFRLVLRDGVSQDLPGKQVTLMADVTGFDPATQIVYVNPVTTLIAHYRDAKPNLTLSQAEAEVRAYLAFPDHLSVGLHVSTGVAHFDRARLLQEARTHRRGLTGFLESVVPEIGTGLVNSFAQPLAASPSQDALVCVNTFAFDPITDKPIIRWGNTEWGVGTANDIRLLTLDRRSLALKDARHFTDTADGRKSMEQFLNTLTNTQIVIVTGGQPGGPPIDDVADLAKRLAGIGAASFAIPDARFPSNPPNVPTTWSVIGIPGNTYGDAYQKGWVDNRFALQNTGKATNCSQPLTTDNRGNLSGYFTADTTGAAFTYTPTEFPNFDTNFSRFQPKADPRSNTMLIGGNPPVTATLPAGFVGGFHRVQVDGRTGQVVVNAMIGTHKNVNGQVVLDPAGVNEFAWVDGFGQPRQGTVGDTLVLMTSVGQTKIATLSPISNTDPRLEWGNGTQIYAQDYGASFHILNTLSDKDLYSMVGVGSPDPQLPFNYAVESSLQVQITPNTPVGRVSGFFKRSRQGYFVPVMGSAADMNKGLSSANIDPDKDNYNPDGSLKALNILEIAYQPPSNWPFSDTPSYQAALKDFSTALSLGTNSPREEYKSTTITWAIPLEKVDNYDVTKLPAGTFPGLGVLYSEAEWEEVRSTLSDEFGWLGTINPYLNSAKQVLDNSGGENQADLKSVGDAVEAKVNASGSKKTIHVLGELFSVTASVFIAAVSAPAPEIAVGLTALMGAYSLAQQAAADAAGHSADSFESTVDQLSSTVQQNTATAVRALESIRVLLATDYGKLSESAPLVNTAWQGGTIGTNEFNTQLEKASTQNYYGMLMEQRWTAYTLEDPKTKLTYSGPGKKTCSDCSTVFCFDVTPWKNVPESSRLNLIWGYDKSGKPIQQGWFWGRDYDSKEKTGKVPPASLSDLMFDIHDDTENVDLSPPIFWWQKNAARRFHCDGSQPHDSRTTGKGQ